MISSYFEWLDAPGLPHGIARPSPFRPNSIGFGDFQRALMRFAAIRSRARYKNAAISPRVTLSSGQNRLFSSEWGAACSDAWWCGSFGPGDAAGVEQDAGPLVVESTEAVAALLDLLGAEVQSLGRPVRCAGRVPGEDLGSPRRERGAERSGLGDLIGSAAGDRLVQRDRCVVVVASEVHVTNTLFASQAPTTSSLGSPLRSDSRIRSRPRSLSRSDPVRSSLRIR